MFKFFHRTQRPPPNCMWEGELRVKRKLGEGSYGEVLLVEDSDVEHFAVKTAATNSTAAKLLQAEYKAYKQLGCLGKAVKGLPQIHAFGYDPRHDGDVLVMSRLGASLRDVMKLNNGFLPTYSVLRIAAQTIRRLQYIHGRGIIHGDIKPRNILCDPKTFERIYIVDFGLASFCKGRKAKKLTTMTTGNKFQGTIDFASRHTHRGISLSRRDDLESFAYTLVYLVKGSLPWSRNREEEYLADEEEMMTSPKPTDHLEILAQKENIPIEGLCEGLPPCIESFVRYVCDLEFYAEPDYPFLIDLFKKGMKQLKEGEDADNGESLNIWPDPDERKLFEFHRNEDEWWAGVLAHLEKREKAAAENEEPTAQESEAQIRPQEEYQQPGQDAARPQEECHQPEQDEVRSEEFHRPEQDTAPKITSKFVDAFQAWKPFDSPRNRDEESQASEVQKGPVIGVGGNRRSLFGKLRGAIKRGAADFQTIFLKREEDSWSEDWQLEDEYNYL